MPASDTEPAQATPLFEVHASVGPAEHRHFDGKIARIEQLQPTQHGQRFRISVDGNVTRDAPVDGAVIVADKTFELRLPAGLTVALAVGQRLQGSIIAGADAQPATTKVLLHDDVGPVVALRMLPAGFEIRPEPAVADAPRCAQISATWPGIKTIASLQGWSAWRIEGREYVLFGCGDVAATRTTAVFALLRQAAT